MHRYRHPLRVLATAAALLVLASACGGTSSSDVDASADLGQRPESEQASADGEAMADDGQTDGEHSDDEMDGEEAPEPDEEPETEGPVAASPHLFPDLSTVNVADGSTVNLADELAGGDTPVLLWFWAPH